jgi:biotin operon repressor
MALNRAVFVVALSGALLATEIGLAQQPATSLNMEGIAQAMGREGALSGPMYKVSIPRSDVPVTIGEVTIKPALALMNWAAFVKSAVGAVSYGDLVLLEDEINPVISKLEENGIEVSALHNHLLHESPRIMYIHFVARGDEVEIAKGLRAALALTGTPLEPRPAASDTKPVIADVIEAIVGRRGDMAGGVFHIMVPRPDVHVHALGAPIPGSMGMNTPLNFQLEGRLAAINGDFMLRAEEVNPVIKALRAHGIEVASLHNHMLDEEPRLSFMHFWAYGDALSLARGLRAALNQTEMKSSALYDRAPLPAKSVD